jgi:hypothetical protein
LCINLMFLPIHFLFHDTLNSPPRWRSWWSKQSRTRENKFGNFRVSMLRWDAQCARF